MSNAGDPDDRGAIVDDDDPEDGRPVLDEATALDEMEADEAFNVLGNETRLGILRALWEASEESLSFTELRDSVGIRQGGQFNYHLDKLVGHFVRQTEGGYTLQYAGRQVMRSLLAGGLTDNPSLAPREIDARCPYCGAGVELSYQNERLTARCMDCQGVMGEQLPEGTFLSFSFPPAGLIGRSPDEVLDAAHVLYDAKITPMMEGVCPECAAAVDHSFDICDDHDTGGDGICESCDTKFEIWVEYRCDHCQYRRRAPAWFELLAEPAVIAFYHEHANFNKTIPFSKLTWENAPYVTSITQSVVARDPLRIRICIPLDNATLEATVDENIEIVELEKPNCE